MLSFRQNFLDWLLDRKPKVRAFFSQVAPLRSQLSLLLLAGFPSQQGPASISILCSSSQVSLGSCGLQEPLRAEVQL